MTRFERATGIGESDWVRHWSRCSELQREAGFEPNHLQGPYDEARVLDALVDLIRERGRFPSFREMRTKAHNDPGFPSSTAFRRLGNRRHLITKLVTYCAGQPDCHDVLKAP